MPDDAAAAGLGHNSAGLVEDFRGMVRDCTPELFQQLVDVLVERGIPDDPARAAERERLLHNFTVIYEKGGDLTTAKGVIQFGPPRLELASQDQHDKAVLLAGKISEAAEAEENTRKTWGAPLFQGNKRLIDAFAPRQDPLVRAHKVLKERIGAFLKMQRDAKEKAEREARAAAQAKEKAAADAAAKGAHNAAQLQAEADTAKLEADRKQKVAADAGRSKSATGGGSHLRVDWDFEVTSAVQIPREFLIPNREAIIREGKDHPDGSPGRVISGVRVFKVTSAVVRK